LIPKNFRGAVTVAARRRIDPGKEFARYHMIHELDPIRITEDPSWVQPAPQRSFLVRKIQQPRQFEGRVDSLFEGPSAEGFRQARPFDSWGDQPRQSTMQMEIENLRQQRMNF
jgi:hypothetical protein